MLYANKNIINGGSFPLLMQALADMGVSAENISIAEEYLNPENDRDNALLDRIERQHLIFSPYYHNHNWEALRKAIEREINRRNLTELNERYFLLIHAINGASCFGLGLFEVSRSRSNEHEAVLKALQSRFGADEAEAILCAIRTEFEFNVRNITIGGRLNVEDKKPEFLLRAVSHAESDNAKLLLVISAMNQIAPSAQVKGLKALFTGKKQDALVSQALKIFDSLASLKSSPSDRNLYIIGLALASGYDDKYFKQFEAEIRNNDHIIGEWVMVSSGLDKDRILNEIEVHAEISQKYISLIANAETSNTYQWSRALPTRDKHLRFLAGKFPFEYKKGRKTETEIKTSRNMEKILISVDNTYQAGETLKEKAKQICMSIVTEDNPNEKHQIEQYLLGQTTTEEFLLIMPKLKPFTGSYFNRHSADYISAYGLDDFAERCICYQIFVNYESWWSLNQMPGYEVKNHESELIQILQKHHVPMISILNACAKITESYYGDNHDLVFKNMLKVFTSLHDEIKDIDLKPLNLEARVMRVHILGRLAKANPDNYHPYLFAAASDSSKNVRNALIDYLPAPEKKINQEILDLLHAKKIAQREIAVALLEKKFPDSYKEDVQKAFDAEKNDKLKERLAGLLHAELPEETKQANAHNLVDELSKGNKGKKVAWLFQNQFTPVHDKNGQEVPEKYLIAITYCYAAMTVLTRSSQADKLANDLNQNDLERFAQEAFSCWIDKGAEAKQKWMIYFFGIHGGLQAVTTLQHYIRDWSDHARGAIACEAVRALALNGSSAALIAVDGMARKFKKHQVQDAANEALRQAAEALHITREELADKIVPDLGFDENLCRIFDYGTRQFRVYLNSALELEIFEGEKKLKTLPKPGKNDDPEKSEQASKEFKEMKKQMKTVIQSQKARLEYVFLCDRKWTVEGWKNLFIHKPIMHCFAIGLIWGAYENDKLIQTFRYMEDGSFNTADEDEYELPENVMIGLVHPIELDEELLSAWREQLSDYEITQPFLQLNRPVYRMLPEEKDKDALRRFNGTEINNLSLAGKMAKFGWDKGYAQDGGAFYEFSRTDIARQEQNKRIGYYVELKFSGMYIATGFYADSSETVTIEEVYFWNLEEDVKDHNYISLNEVNPKYFSEIVSQLMSVFGAETVDKSE